MHLVNSRNIQIKGVPFESNDAKLGGAIFVVFTEDILTEFSVCVFEGNKASDGGAVYLATGSGVDGFAASGFRDNFAGNSPKRPQCG